MTLLLSFFHFKPQNKIDNIHLKQQAKAEQRILEQFEMENLIYTQDAIYLKVLSEISKPDDKFSKENFPVFDIKSMYPEMLQAYYQVWQQILLTKFALLSFLKAFFFYRTYISAILSHK